MEKRKHPEHTRFESERKGKVKSVRMTNEQYEAIKRNAEKNKQTMSSYMAIVASKPSRVY